MKANKRIALIFGASLLTLSATGCAHFPSFVPVELKDIEIVASPFKTFVKDDLFEECADLEIKGYYTNGKTKTLDKSNVELIYVSNDTGVGYSIKKEIPDAGDYSLRARYKGITSSKCFEFSAVQYHEYIDSIEIGDAPENMVFPLNAPQRFTLNINPGEYTERLSFDIQDTTIATIDKIDKNTFEINGKKEGKTSIYFSSTIFSGKELYIKDWMFELIIRNVFVDYLIPVGPKKVTKGEKINISYIAEPVGINVPIEAFSTDESVLTINKINNYLFEVKGINVGSAGIVLFGKKSFTDYYYSTVFQIEVENIYVQSIKINGPTFVGKGNIIELNLAVSPNNFTVPIGFIIKDKKAISVQKQTATKYLITGLNYGKTEVCFFAASSSNSCTTVVQQIEVGDVYINSISVDKHITVRAGNTYTLNLAVSPSNFTIDIEYYVSTADAYVISVDRVTKTKYKVKGIGNGEGTIYFRSEQDDYGWYTEAYCDVTVLPSVEKTIIPLHLTDFVSTNCPSQSTSTNPIRILTIPVWFEDSSDYYSESDMQDMWDNIRNAYFASSTPQNFEYESVASYFYKESYGQCVITGTMADWCKLSIKGSEVEEYDDASQIVKLATMAYFGKHPNTQKLYDHNGDGFIDAVTLVYAYPPNDKGDALWAYKYQIDNAKANKTNPNPCVFTWSSYDFMSMKRTDASKLNARVYIHEFGHVFGLKDYYDNEAKVDWSSSPNMQANNRGGHDPYSVMALGWANPYIPMKSCTLQIGDFQSTGDFVILSPRWNALNSPFDEYIVVELIGESGLDEDDFINYYKLYDKNHVGAHAGIRVYHVDARFWNRKLKGYSNNPKTSNSFAFDNVSNLSADYLSLDNIAQLHMIRKDPNVNDLYDTDKITYYHNKGLVKSDLFYDGDTFDYDSYRNQFFKYYENRRKYVAENGEPNNLSSLIKMNTSLDQYKLMNNGYKLGWSFEVIRINSRSNGSFVATIVFTKN